MAYITVGANPAAIKAAQHAILRIIGSRVGDAVKIRALSALAKLCEVKNVAISNNVFHGKG